MGMTFRAVLIQPRLPIRHLLIFSRSIPMMDVVMVALAVGFFALSIAYVYACEQL
jgi:hypothetical protein